MSETLKLVITADTKEAIDAIQQFAKGVDGVKSKLGTLANVQGQSTQALTNFNRVVQDAPYGIQGIANNIDPLVLSFQGLQKSTGSVGGALKAMAGSLMGPAGIAIAISAITTIAIKFGDDIVKYFTNAKTSVEDLRKSLSELNQELLQIVGKAESTGFKAQVLGGIAIDGKDITQRENALADLKELYKTNADVQNLSTKSDKAYMQSVINKAAQQSANASAEKAYNDNLAKLLEDRKLIISEGNKKIAKVTEEQLVQPLIGAKRKQKGKDLDPILGRKQTIKQQQDAAKEELKLELQKHDAKIALAKQKNKELIVANTSFERATTKKSVKKTVVEEIVDQAKEDNKALKKQLIEMKNLREQFKRIGTGVQLNVEGERDRKLAFAQEKKRVTGKDTKTSMGTFLEKDAAKKMSQYTSEAILMEAKLNVLNEQMQTSKDITSVLAPQFDAVFASMIMGEDVGLALANAFEQIAIQLITMVAQMIIFRTIMAALTSGTTEVAEAATGIASGVKGGVFGEFLLKGSDLVLSTQRANRNNKLKK